MKLSALASNTAVVICEAVFHKELPLGFIANQIDGPQATCNVKMHGSKDGDCKAKIVGLGCLADFAPDGADLPDLEMGYYASRQDGAWVIERLQEEDEA